MLHIHRPLTEGDPPPQLYSKGAVALWTSSANDPDEDAATCDHLGGSRVTGNPRMSTEARRGLAWFARVVELDLRAWR